jgi:hypothetical protein
MTCSAGSSTNTTEPPREPPFETPQAAELARRGGPGDPEALTASARELLRSLGVVSTPRVPLL